MQEKAGFVPNVFLMLAHRPAEFRAFFDYHDTLMEKDVGLSKAEREMIVVATSGANNCLYCVVAHGAVLRIRAKNPRVADQLATNYRKAEITARQRDARLRDEAVARRGRVEDADMAALREHGFDDEAIWDIGAITAFFSMSNRLVHLTGTPPNEQFYLMGRLPKRLSAAIAGCAALASGLCSTHWPRRGPVSTEKQRMSAPRILIFAGSARREALSKRLLSACIRPLEIRRSPTQRGRPCRLPGAALQR